MTCHYVKVPGGIAIACTRGGRGRSQRCAACGSSTDRLCDGCDRPVCPHCSVGHTSEADFCPACALEAFRAWCAGPGLEHCAPAVTRDARRRAFRAWVRANPTDFLARVQMSAEGRRANP